MLLMPKWYAQTLNPEMLLRNMDIYQLKITLMDVDEAIPRQQPDSFRLALPWCCRPAEESRRLFHVMIALSSTPLREQC